MDIAILVEPVAGNMFRASCGSLLALQMDAPTREEAIQKLQKELDEGSVETIPWLEVRQKLRARSNGRSTS